MWEMADNVNSHPLTVEVISRVHLMPAARQLDGVVCEVVC